MWVDFLSSFFFDFFFLHVILFALKLSLYTNIFFRDVIFIVISGICTFNDIECVFNTGSCKFMRTYSIIPNS